eukprot:2187387-Pyramimonas_sp.AAC.1
MHTTCVQRLEADMFEYFDKHQIPRDRRLGGLTLKMLGSDRNMGDHGEIYPGTTLKAKAAESRILLEITRWEIKEVGEGMRFREPFLAAVDALDEWLDVYQNADTVLTQQQY